jgi:hypothetical protein
MQNEFKKFWEDNYAIVKQIGRWITLPDGRHIFITEGGKHSRLPAQKLNQIVSDINEGGITYDVVRQRALGGKQMYAVSIYPERTKIFKDKITRKDIIDYLKANRDLLSKKGHSLGGWLDTATKQIYIDVSATLSDRSKAIALGKKYNQKAIFDLKNFTDIPTGGTGENIGRYGDIGERARMVETLAR